MTEVDGQTEHSGTGQVVVYRGDSDYVAPDRDQIISWMREHAIVLAGALLVAVQVVWRAQFLSGMFFRQDDFHVLDFAIERSFSWSYLTFNGAGHLIIGPRAVAWPLARTSLYNWGLDSGLILVLLACAGLAALRLLRTLFGDHPTILLPLAVYLFSPLALPVLGEWSAALEAVPLQIAIFMALNAHVNYIRTDRRQHLVAAVAWVAVGMIFFEKGLVLPPLLFAVTSAFLVNSRSWLAGMRLSLTRFRQAWVCYGILMVVYGALLESSFHTSHVQPTAPKSISAMLTFGWTLVSKTLLPGAIGGPWRWFPPGGSYALAAPPGALAYLALLLAAVIVTASIWRRPIAWRSWAILAGWVIAADMVPVLIGRLDYLSPQLLGMDTRYLADAAPIIAICLGLAFLPLADGRSGAAEASDRYHWTDAHSQAWRTAAAALTGVFAVSSIWSAQAYQSATTGAVASSYIANATRALELAPRGTPVVDSIVPPQFDTGLTGNYVMASEVVGDMERGSSAGKLGWVTVPHGTIDNLMTFGNDGRLHLAAVYGTSSARSATKGGCWPDRRGRIVVRFTQPSPVYTTMLRIGYIWGAAQPAFVLVQYGTTVQGVQLIHGLHSAYIPVTGSATSIVISDLGSAGVCIGDAEAGLIEAGLGGQVIPPTESH
jgi:hypothetical protein